MDLRANGEELLTIVEHQQCIVDDRDEIAWLREELAASKAELETLKKNQ